MHLAEQAAQVGNMINHQPAQNAIETPCRKRQRFGQVMGPEIVGPFVIAPY